MTTFYILDLGLVRIALKNSKHLQTVLDTLGGGTFVDHDWKHEHYYRASYPDNTIKLHVVPADRVHLTKTMPRDPTPEVIPPELICPPIRRLLPAPKRA